MKYMEIIRNALSIKEQKTSLRVLLLLMMISYVFSIAVRYIWVAQVYDIPSYQWNDQIMINTNDGYFFAQGARDILDGTKLYPHSPVNVMASKITALFAKILPFSFETIILYMPAFLGSLLIIPVMLIARSLGLVYVGFGASLIAGIAWSYYNRTMVGYYDTDMLNIVLPTMVLSLVIYSIHKKKLWLFPILSAVMLFYTDWYQTTFYYTPLLLAALFYVLIYERKNLYNYQLLSIFMVSMSSLGFETISIVVLFMTALFYWMQSSNMREDIEHKIIYGIFGVSFIMFLTSGGFMSIYSKLEVYVFRKAFGDDLSLVFYNVAGTVREAGIIPFETFANRISGGVWLLFASSIGVVLLIIRYPIMLLSLPLVAIGFVAIKGGLRFTVYTVPINALGMSFVIFLFSSYVRKILSSILPFFAQKIVYISILTALFSINLYYHIEHIEGYRVPTVFDKKEVTILEDLNKKSDSKDYVVSWWDYGYPIRYYGGVQTLIDGGAHDGINNFPVSYSMLKPQVASANMLRLTVEYEAKSLLVPRAGPYVKNMTEDYKAKTPKEFLSSLHSKSFTPPPPSREIYLYLPYRMVNIFPTVMLFANLDITTGRPFPRPLFLNSPVRAKNANEIVLSQGVKIFIQNNNATGKIKIGGATYNIKHFITTYYDGNMKLQKSGIIFDKKSAINVIYMRDYQKFIVLDDTTLNSTYVQLFVLENIDHSLFEPVSLDPQVKVYRLKI